MRILRTPIAILLAAVLAWAALRAQEGADKPGLAARAPLVPAGTLDPERLVEVQLERDGIVHRFERREGAWWQTAPVEHPVDGWSMRQFAARVLKSESVRVVPLAVEGDARDAALRAAGFAPPVGRIVLVEDARDGAPRRTVEVELGRRSLAGRAYARVRSGQATAESDRYQVVDATLHEYALERDPREFRRRELFPDLAEVTRIDFASGPNRVEISRQGREYRFTAPVATRADRAQVEEVLEAIRRARSDGFVTDTPNDLSIYGLEPAAATLVVVDGGGVSRTLRIGDTVSIGAQDRFGLVEGTRSVVRLPASALATILPRVERIVDPLATAVRAPDVGTIEIIAGAQRVTLRREVDRWIGEVGTQGEAGGVAGTFEREAVDRLLGALVATRATSVQLAELPAGVVATTVVLRGFAGEPLDTVRAATDAAGSRVLFENGDGVLRVHGAIDLPLSPDALGFRARAP